MIKTQDLEAFAAELDASLIHEIEAVATSKQFRKDDIIIDIGQELRFIPLLINGSIKVMREDTNGNELLLYILEAGDTCAMSLTCCMAQSKSKIRAIADSDIEVIMIPLDYMSLWFHSNESWRTFILKSYQIRFDEMLDTIDTLAFLKMDQRLLKYLKEKSTYGNSKIINSTHQDIAQDLNTSRVVVSRLLKQLEKDNIIKLGRNTIQIL